MNEVATFFRNREQDPGETYHFQVKAEKVAYRFSVYSRNPIESRVLQDRQVANEKECAAIYKDVLAAVGSLGGGGLVVTVMDDGGLRHLQVNPLASSGFQPPQQFIVLAPARPAYPLPCGKDLELPAGAHAIVPVDEAAEKRLQMFMDQLPWFSPDLESLVLNAIRRPSLDVRLSKVETRVFGQTADAALAEAGAGRGARLKGRLRRAMSRSSTYWLGAVLLLALLLGINAFLLYRMNSKLVTPAAATTTTSGSETPAEAAETQGNLGQGGTADKGADATGTLTTEAFVDETKDLFSYLREKQVSDNALNLLYVNHFASFDRGSLTDQQIEELFRKRGAQEQGNGNRPFLLGIIKLQALKLDPQPADPTFLRQWDNITPMKNVFKKIGLDNLDSKGLRLVAALSCRLGYSTPLEAPGLPATSSTSPQLEFAPGHKCEEYTATDIENGLAELVEFVKDR